MLLAPPAVMVCLRCLWRGPSPSSLSRVDCSNSKGTWFLTVFLVERIKSWESQLYHLLLSFRFLHTRIHTCMQCVCRHIYGYTCLYLHICVYTHNIHSHVYTHVWCAQSCLTLCDPMDYSQPDMEFSRQGYWSGLPFPTPRDFPDPEIEPKSLESPTLAGDFLPLHHIHTRMSTRIILHEV